MASIPAEKKCSAYSIRFTGPDDVVISSAPKLWIQDFQIDKEAGNVGRTDLNFTTKMQFQDMDLEKVKHWLTKDLFVELYHQRPVTKDKVQDDGQVQQEVVLGSDGHPVTEEILLGVSETQFDSYR